MKTQEHINSFIKFALMTFTCTFLITGFVWIMEKLCRAVVEILQQIIYSGKTLENKRIQETIEFYKMHGRYCPACKMHVPEGYICANCNNIFPDALPEHRREFFETMQDG